MMTQKLNKLQMFSYLMVRSLEREKVLFKKNKDSKREIESLLRGKY